MKAYRFILQHRDEYGRWDTIRDHDGYAVMVETSRHRAAYMNEACQLNWRWIEEEP